MWRRRLRGGDLADTAGTGSRTAGEHRREDLGSIDDPWSGAIEVRRPVDHPDMVIANGRYVGPTRPLPGDVEFGDGSFRRESARAEHQDVGGKPAYVVPPLRHAVLAWA